MPKLYIAALTAVALVSLSACSSPICTTGAAPRAYKVGGLSPAPLGFVGSPLTVLVEPPPVLGVCGAGTKGVDAGALTATAEVLDPKNLPVTSSVLVDDGGAHVSFTPQLPGPFHVSVRFEPGDALAQTDALIVRDVSSTTQGVPADCSDHLEALSDTTVRCGWNVYRGAERVDSFPTAQLVASDGVLWKIDQGEVSRLIDQGTGPLVASPAASAAALGTPTTLWASATELWTLDGQLNRFVVGTDGVVAQNRVQIPEPTATWVLVHGARLEIVAQKADTSAGDGVFVCPFVFTSTDVTPAGDCTAIAGRAVGIEKDAVWIFLEDPLASTGGGSRSGGGALSLWALGDDGVVEAAKVRIDGALQLQPATPDGVPTVLFSPYPGGYGATTSPQQILVPRLEGGDIVFDSVGSPGSSSVYASGRLAWTYDYAQTSTHIFRRTQ